jgi:hypothetical protein
MKESESIELKRSLVEAWGRGMPLILKNEPSAKFKEVAKLFIASFDRPSFMDDEGGSIDKTPQVAPQVTPQVTPQVMQLLGVMKGAEDRGTLRVALGLKARKNFRLLYLVPAIEAGLIEMTIPDKPNSRLQKYRLTKKGRNLIAKAAKEAGADEK